MRVQKKGDSEGREVRSRSPISSHRTNWWKDRWRTEREVRAAIFFVFLFCLFECWTSRLSHDDTRRITWHFLPARATITAIALWSRIYAQHQHTGSASRCLVVREADRWLRNEAASLRGRVFLFPVRDGAFDSHLSKTEGGSRHWNATPVLCGTHPCVHCVHVAGLHLH